VWHSGSLVHGEVTAKAISKIADIRPVELAAVKFLAMGSLQQIATAVPLFSGDLGAALEWLVDDSPEDWARFTAHSEEVALVAVAGAFRLRLHQGDPSALDALMDDSRERISDAARYVERFKPLPRKGRDILHRIAGDPSEG
jgi:hypothetical protein